MRHGSLFSGIGGFDLAARWMGWENAFHSEIDPFCLQILKYHFPDAVTYTDIRNTDFTPWRDRIDVLSGGFPCFVAGTMILTESGLKPIEDIRAGERVYTKNGRLCTVNAAMRNEIEEIVSIKAQGIATPIQTTTNHPFWVKPLQRYWKPRPKKHGEARWVDASDIQKGDMVAYRCIEGKEQYRTPDFWKMVGYYLGNGWILDGKCKSNIPQGNRGSRINSRVWKVVLCCNKEKKEQLHQTITDAGYHATISEDRTTYKFIICSKELVLFLADFGRYAHGKKLSGQCFELADKYKQALFEGWRDADGYIAANGSFCVTTVSAELAYGMAQIARDVYKRPVSLKKSTPNRECRIEGRLVNERPQFQLNVSPDSRYGYYEDGFLWCLVKNISKKPQTTTVHNIAVEEDETYLANGITVHNCQPFSQAGKRKGTSDDRHLWPEMLRAIREIRPRWVVGENVLGITNWDGGVVFEQVCADLEAEGYSVQPTVLPACGINAPHQRYRTWFTAHRNDDELFARLPLPEQIWAALASDGCSVTDPDGNGDRVQECGGSGKTQRDEEQVRSDYNSAGEPCGTDSLDTERRNSYGYVSDNTGGYGDARYYCGSVADPDGRQREMWDIERSRTRGTDRPEDISGEIDRTARYGDAIDVANTDSSRLPGRGLSSVGENSDKTQRSDLLDRIEGFGIQRTSANPDIGGLEGTTSVGRDSDYAQRQGCPDGEGKASPNTKQQPSQDERTERGGVGETDLGQEAGGPEHGDLSKDWLDFPTQSPVCSRDDGLSIQLHNITFPRWRKESIKAYGNAIVPQVAYRIFRVIEFMSNGR